MFQGCGHFSYYDSCSLHFSKPYILKPSQPEIQGREWKVMEGRMESILAAEGIRK